MASSWPWALPTGPVLGECRFWRISVRSGGPPPCSIYRPLCHSCSALLAVWFFLPAERSGSFWRSPAAWRHPLSCCCRPPAALQCSRRSWRSRWGSCGLGQSPTSRAAPSSTRRHQAQSVSCCRWWCSFLFSSRVPRCSRSKHWCRTGGKRWWLSEWFSTPPPVIWPWLPHFPQWVSVRDSLGTESYHPVHSRSLQCSIAWLLPSTMNLILLALLIMSSRSAWMSLAVEKLLSRPTSKISFSSEIRDSMMALSSGSPAASRPSLVSQVVCTSDQLVPAPKAYSATAHIIHIFYVIHIFQIIHIYILYIYTHI